MALDLSTATLAEIAESADPRDASHARKMIEAGCRGAPCPCGYGVLDTCPEHDRGRD